MFQNEFIERYKQWGFNAKEVELQECIRVNTVKITEEELIQRLKKRGFELEKVKFLENGYFVKRAKHSLSALQEYLQGFFYIQEAAAQLPAMVLNASSEDIVLDCCASPGGKTTQLAVKAKAVIALESQHNRIPALLNNIERLSIKNTIVCNTDARTFEPDMKFKKILIDAPCSGNYAIDRRWSQKQSLANIKARSEIQKEILSNIINCLEDNGEIVYSTCSLEPEENEMIVDWMIKELGMKVLDIDCFGEKGITKPFETELDKSIEKCRRIWPGITQGFFIARLQL
ncbi:MAG: RsmB/NOP family class I SAM-dependent RNA methyltransferase [Nanoarchaeota archaeon]|nr:RsmB/NOP family class I SAM-dependent RNA methyltransferase [Nanoarchaeota archaeon]